MTNRRLSSACAAAIACAALAMCPAAVSAQNTKTGSLTQVGHEPLMDRGMNAAMAIQGDFAYIGSRTDGGHVDENGDPMPHGGIMVVDISDPSNPELQGPPFDANAGESTRELRVWRSQDVLIVLNTNCGVGDALHHCTAPSISNFRFYDISGDNASDPQLLNQFDVNTHEFFLWEDPNDPERALIFAGSAGSSCGTSGGSPTCPFSVWDISGVPDGDAPVTLFSGLHGFTRFPAQPLTCAGPDGSPALADDQQRRQQGVLRAADRRVRRGRRVRLREPRPDAAAAQDHAQPEPARVVGAGSPQRGQAWGRDWAWVSDEVYGTATGSGHGCPWGWARMIDISDPTAPTVEADYRLPENQESSCDDWDPAHTSYSAHNPTLTPHIAFTTWHSGGFQAVSIQNAHRPYQLAEFFPEPLDMVMLEDPRLSNDPDTGRNEKVVMWSYPIVQDGLIYVIDLRNGLYVLRYKGAFENEVIGSSSSRGTRTRATRSATSRWPAPRLLRLNPPVRAWASPRRRPGRRWLRR